MIKIGDIVEDFTAQSTSGVFTLSERVKNGPVLLYLYVVNYGKTCTDYMAKMIERSEDFESRNISLVHVNPDSVENHLAWMNHTGSGFEHISDDSQKISRMFDCIITEAKNEKIIGNTNRGFFLIDGDMRLRFSWIAEIPSDTVPMDSLFESIDRVL